MIARRLAAAIALGVALAACGGASPGEQVRSDVRTIQEERTPEKLVDRCLETYRASAMPSAKAFDRPAGTTPMPPHQPRIMQETRG